VNNGALNIAPDGTPLMPILRLARESGFGTGLVTTATVTHATPAGFAAQVPSRNEEPTIALQYLEAGIDVLLGGGGRFFDAAVREDGRDLFSAYAQSGYTVVRDADALRQHAGDTRVLGVFGNSHLPYSLDQRNDPDLKHTVPTLAAMMRGALGGLAGNPKGFILQVEAARVDHAAHSNDIGGLLYDQLAFDDAIAEATAFAEGRDDTLVIVTTDHGNANPALNAEYGRYGGTEKCFERLAAFKHTNSWILGGLSAGSTPVAIRGRVHEATGIALPDDDVDMLRRALREEHRDAYHVRSAAPITLGQLLSNHVSVGWTGTSHTTDHVELAAFGPGSELIPGFIRNHALFDVMTAAVHLPRPKMTGAGGTGAG
jgi:alkaline phosphatase